MRAPMPRSFTLGNAAVACQRLKNTLINYVLSMSRRVGRGPIKRRRPFYLWARRRRTIHFAASGVVVEVISGLTSGIAVPAAFDIPLTYRHIAQTATFVTGTTSGNDEVCWRSMVELSGTLVIYMGISRLEHITQRLLASGLDPDMP